MIQVINGRITQYSLPKVGTLSNGSTVSGYHLLDEAILASEGWLPLEDNSPLYDVITEQLIEDGYEILEDKVVKKYRIEPIPEIVEPVDLQAQILELQAALDAIIGGETIE